MPQRGWKKQDSTQYIKGECPSLQTISLIQKRSCSDEDLRAAQQRIGETFVTKNGVQYRISTVYRDELRRLVLVGAYAGGTSR